MKKLEKVTTVDNDELRRPSRGGGLVNMGTFGLFIRTMKICVRILTDTQLNLVSLRRILLRLGINTKMPISCIQNDM